MFGELRQGRLAAVLALGWRRFLFGFEQFVREGERLLQELDAIEQPLLVPVLEVIQSLGQGLETRASHVPAETADHLDLDFLHAVLGIRRPEYPSSRSASSTRSRLRLRRLATTG